MNPAQKIGSRLREYPLAVLSGILVLVCSMALYFRSGVIQELSVREVDLLSRIRTMDQNAKNARNLKEDVVEVELLVEQIEARLFKRDQRAVNINFFYGLEERLNVRIANIDQMPAEDPIYAKGGAQALNLYSTITYNVDLNGTFGNILLFLHELHRSDPLIRVTDYQIVKANESSADNDLLDARLRLLVLAEK